jgi:hypothetical protein
MIAGRIIRHTRTIRGTDNLQMISSKAECQQAPVCGLCLWLQYGCQSDSTRPALPACPTVPACPTYFAGFTLPWVASRPATSPEFAALCNCVALSCCHTAQQFMTAPAAKQQREVQQLLARPPPADVVCEGMPHILQLIPTLLQQLQQQPQAVSVSSSSSSQASTSSRAAAGAATPAVQSSAAAALNDERHTLLWEAQQIWSGLLCQWIFQCPNGGTASGEQAIGATAFTPAFFERNTCIAQHDWRSGPLLWCS